MLTKPVPPIVSPPLPLTGALKVRVLPDWLWVTPSADPKPMGTVIVVLFNELVGVVVIAPLVIVSGPPLTVSD
jgi:hypothetical protein